MRGMSRAWQLAAVAPMIAWSALLVAGIGGRWARVLLIVAIVVFVAAPGGWWRRP